MIAPLRDTLAATVPEPVKARPDLVERLAARLLKFHTDGGPPERPEPRFTEEVTPPVGPVFEPFRGLLTALKVGETESAKWAEAFATAGVEGVLLLLGQRRTPASLTDATALPPTRERLLASADSLCNPAKTLSVAGRAGAKHAPRSESKFWGLVRGGDAEKNASARRLLETILDNPTWWNVFGHYVHETVFEARVSSGHGARWGHNGAEFIGFLEPFLNADKDEPPPG